MPDFAWVKAPIFTPTQCITCSTHASKDGFVDLVVDNVEGRVYMCASCIEQAGRRVGMLAKREADKLAARVAEAHDAITALERELEAERENKVVPLADVKKLLAKSAA